MTEPARLRAALAVLQAEARFITYAALSARIGLAPPGRIARLSTLLEILMEEDALAQTPLRAALVLSRTPKNLPARGFFLKAAALGLFDPCVQTQEDFHRAEVLKLLSRWPSQPPIR